MLLITDTMNELNQRLVDLNYGVQTEYPEWSYLDEKNIDYYVKRSEAFKNLYETGWQVSQQDVEDEFDISVEPHDVTGNTPGETAKQYIDNFITEYWNMLHPGTKLIIK